MPWYSFTVVTPDGGERGAPVQRICRTTTRRATTLLSSFARSNSAATMTRGRGLLLGTAKARCTPFRF
jgi:hypothetical protein